MTTVERIAVPVRALGRLRLSAASLALALGMVALVPASAQEPATLPRLPDVAARPVGGPGSLGSFIEGLSQPEATFDVKLGHGRILTLKNDLFAGDKNQPTLAVGDPTIVDFTVLSPRQIRLVGTRLGTTDLAISMSDGKTLTFEVRVIADLDLIRGQLRQAFPDASLKLGQVGSHLVVEGQARDSSQAAQILEILRGAVPSMSSAGGGGGAAPAAAPAAPNAAAPSAAPPTPINPQIIPGPPDQIGGYDSGTLSGSPIEILNLIRVPGAQQVLLKVRIAELNRTALRQIGGNFIALDSRTGSIFGNQIGGPVTASGSIGFPGSLTTPLPLVRARQLNGAAVLNSTSSATVFGIFQKSNFEFLLNALRQNSILKILAEPNLVALNGHEASFLAGGEFPVPVPQVAATGVASTVTVLFKQFGVHLNFLPTILDGDVIRLSVDPEVSSIDQTIGTTLVAGGTPVPGLNTRKAHTTVELQPGQTLAIAGLLQLTLNGETTRIPGFGDLPILGPFFSNTTSDRIEKELIVLVTPYLVSPMNCDQVPPGPGDEVGAPNDLEFYLLNRIEGRTGKDWRATTTDGTDPLHFVQLLHLERKFVHGPSGFSE